MRGQAGALRDCGKEVIQLSTVLIFNRKVIPLPDQGKGAAKVECEIIGYLDGEHTPIGEVKFPNKQSWTKFWGAIQRGALQVPNMEVKMENVMPEEAAAAVEGKDDKSVRFIGKPDTPVGPGAVNKPSQGGGDATVK